jgi:hypothetical protein
MVLWRARLVIRFQTATEGHFATYYLRKLFPTPETTDRYRERTHNAAVANQCINPGICSKLFAPQLEPSECIFDLP